MTDRELLELAAKAAGIDGGFVENDDWYGTGVVFTDENDCNQTWNPLTDDGDALRLAVKLGFRIEFRYKWIVAGNRNIVWDDDEYRRAIVRASAIGASS
jgi:hypothetical protein